MLEFASFTVLGSKSTTPTTIQKVQTPDQSKTVASAKSHIQLAFQHKDDKAFVENMFKLVHEEALMLKHDGNFTEGGKVDDVLFEACLEFALSGDNATAVVGFDILNTRPHQFDDLPTVIDYHPLAVACKNYCLVEQTRRFASDLNAYSSLKIAVNKEDRGLKVAPFFLGQMIEKSNTLSTKKAEAQTYFQMSADRGYQPASDYLRDSSISNPIVVNQHALTSKVIQNQAQSNKQEVKEEKVASSVNTNAPVRVAEKLPLTLKGEFNPNTDDYGRPYQ